MEQAEYETVRLEPNWLPFENSKWSSWLEYIAKSHDLIFYHLETSDAMCVKGSFEGHKDSMFSWAKWYGYADSAKMRISKILEVSDTMQRRVIKITTWVLKMWVQFISEV